MAQLPAGMRNFNPGNIKYVGQAGTRPSINTDQGDPQAVYSSPEAGMAAMYGLLRRKYVGGKVTANDIIAGQGGWTPGNFQAAANVARAAGISPTANINFGDPAAAQRFMRGLLLQEHGPASNAYSDAMIATAISGAPVPAGSFPQTMPVAKPQVRTPQQAVDAAPIQPPLQPAMQTAAMPQNPMSHYMQSVFGAGSTNESDWMENRSYSADAMLGDVLAGHSPLRRLAYQKIMGLFT